jgi:outer membrane protein OmpA-like peptidoglycan-associated protein
MRHPILALVLSLIGSTVAMAQRSSKSPEDPARIQISAGYDYVRANAPPGTCDCFGLQGAYASAGFGINNWLSIDAQATGQHGKDISALGQDLTLLTFAAGPKVRHDFGKVELFGQLLLGTAHGSDSYFPTGNTYTTSASSFALTTGGGLDYLFSKHFSIRIFNAQYLRSQLPNNVDNEQNELMLSAGIVYRFHDVKGPTILPAAPSQLALSCSSNVNTLDQGDTLRIIAKSITLPENLAVTYQWTSTVGTIEGTGDQVTLNTQGIPAGSYHVTGRATGQAATSLSAECDVPFIIMNKPEPPAPPPPPPPPAPSADQKDREFHDNVPDALFDFDSSAIRPDAKVAVEHAAQYLHEHPEIVVLIGGFADDRGTGEYNMVLGERRAEAARKALVAAGVDPGRLQIISYGKKVQVCTTEDEQCRQQNRRAAFSMHP